MATNQPTKVPEQLRKDFPAKYTDALLPVFAEIMRRYGVMRVLDPFAGTGKIFDLEPLVPGVEIEATEIEWEWAALHPRTTHWDALEPLWADGWFDCICTSPTYGNRLADKHNARDASRRRSYTFAKGKPLAPNNSGRLQWGSEYRRFHMAAWQEMERVLAPNGIFILNIKDHIRDGRVVPVADWHARALQSMGLRLAELRQVETPGLRYGANHRARVAFENVIVFQKGKQTDV